MAAQTLLLLPVLQGWLLVGVRCATSPLVGVRCATSPLVGLGCASSPLVGVWYVSPPLVGGIQNTGTSLREAALVFGLSVLIGLLLTDLLISRSDQIRVSLNVLYISYVVLKNYHIEFEKTS